SNGNISCGGFWAPNPSSGALVSTNGGQSTSSVSNSSNMGSSVYSIAVNPVGGDAWLGTEQMGIYRSTDNGFTWTQASPPDTNVDPTNGIRDGNIYGITFRPKRQCSFQLAGWHLEILEDLRRIQLDQCSHQQQHRFSVPHRRPYSIT